MVVFESFQGRNISCNPKALYEEMKNNPKYKDYTLVWSLRNPNRTDVKNAVKFESFGYYRALAKAKYWIFNSNPRMFLKPKADQIFVQTWHGTPLKKIGLDVEKQGNALTNKSQMKNIYVEESKKITYMISPSKYCTDKFISAFNMKNVSKENNVLTTGYPRNDYLFKFTKDQCTNIKKELNIPTNKKVVLYAPTFRDNQYNICKRVNNTRNNRNNNDQSDNRNKRTETTKRRKKEKRAERNKEKTHNRDCDRSSCSCDFCFTCSIYAKENVKNAMLK